MVARSVGLRIEGALFAVAALVVLVWGGFVTACNSFEPGCSDQGAEGAVTSGLLTAAGVSILVVAAVAAFRWARGPSPLAGAIVVGVVVVALGLWVIVLTTEPSPPPALPDPTPSSLTSPTV